MTYKFTQPVSMLVNDEQFIEISKELERIGYENNGQCHKDNVKNILIYTNAGGNDNAYSSVYEASSQEFKNEYNRIFISSFNKNLFLHLAALNDDVQFFRKGELIRSKSTTGLEMTVDGVAGYNVNQHPYHTKMSKEEILAYYKMEQIGNDDVVLITQKQKEMKQEEIIGYKLIKPEYVKAACRIEGYVSFGESIVNGSTITLKGKEKAFDKLKDAEVLDKWFEPVYAVKEVVMSIPYNKGELKILIKNKGHIEIVGESVVNIEDLRKFLNEDFHKCKTKVGGFDTIVKISHISVGCKKDISIEDVRKVVLAHDELFNI